MFKFNKDEIKKVINNLAQPKILVVGDFAIDEMVYGQATRISREAPVLILKHTQTKHLLGAASNAAGNISSISAGNAIGVGVYGDDYHGPILLNALQQDGVIISKMVQEEKRATTTKTRVSGNSIQSVTQQIVRVDRESREPLKKETEDKIIEHIKTQIPLCDGVILSDYGIGVVSDKIIQITIQEAKKHNKVVAVDAQENLGRFQGATVLTPNQPDASKAVGFEIRNEETLLQAGKKLLEMTNAQMILLTRGSEGMSLFERNGNISHIPAFNQKAVFDVTGAGDTVVASFTLGICAKGTPFESAIIGNLAASIVVKQFGCASTTIEELLATIEKLNIIDYSAKA